MLKENFRDKRRKVIYFKVELPSEQKDAVDTLCLESNGEKLSYTWHQHYTAFTGHFDTGYMPELLYIPEFERILNLNTGMTNVLENKNFLPRLRLMRGLPHFKRLFYAFGRMDS